MNDNVPFGSREFKDFAHEWGIKTTTSSPTYAQSNGQTERYVQTLKGLLKKAIEEGRNSYLASISYSSTETHRFLVSSMYSVSNADGQAAPFQTTNEAEFAATKGGTSA